MTKTNKKEKLILPVRIDKSTGQKRVTIPKEEEIGDKGYVEVRDNE